MLQLPSRKYLSCFYCGKKTRIRNDGRTRKFDCDSCEATNYLDKHGEITDPPVATTSASSSIHYAQPPRSPKQTSSVFCDTCLKNQRLFTASLAQYEEPTEGSSREAERAYYRWRKQLEDRYPQVCEACRSKVDKKVRDARYTAQTDHLRRMTERTRQNTREKRTWTPLHAIHGSGALLWRLGFLLQLAWHAVQVVSASALGDDGMRDPDDQSVMTLALTKLALMVDALPTQLLIRTSFTLGLAAVWWNPFFVQAQRGFTRHLSGFKQWYCFQALSCGIRGVLGYSGVLEHLASTGSTSTRQAILTAHAGAFILTALIYQLSRKSIRADTRPLFATEKTPSLPPSKESSPKAVATGTASPLGFAESMSKALDEPAFTPRSLISEPSSKSLGSPYPPNKPMRMSGQGPAGLAKFGQPAVSLGDDAAAGEADAMDWQPTASTHRAFQPTAPGKADKLFSTTPASTEHGPFWYNKAPEAPQHLNHRLRKPPNRPVIRSQPRAEDTAKPPTFGDHPWGVGDAVTDSGGVTFSHPKFFAPDKDAEEANRLAAMLNGGFSFHDDEDLSRGQRGNGDNEGGVRRGIFARSDGGDGRDTKPEALVSRRDVGFSWVEMAGFMMFWLCWLLSGWSSVESRILADYVRVSTLGLASLLSIRCLLVMGRGYREGAVRGSLPIVLMSLRGVEIAAATGCAVAWMAGYDMEAVGGGIVCLMMGHHVVESVL